MHRAVDDPDELGPQRVDVDLLAQARGERIDRVLGVVVTAIETMIDSRLHAPKDGTSQRRDHERRDGDEPVRCRPACQEQRRDLQRDENEERLSLLGRTRGLAAIGLGISISMDELAIGFTIGLLRFSIFLVVILIGVQTFVVTQMGMRLGQRVGERIREGAERLAGVALAVLRLVLAGEKLVH